MVRGIDFVDQRDMIGNGFTTTETRIQHDSFHKGVSNSPIPQPRTTQMFSSVATTANNNALPKVHHRPDENGDVKPTI